MLFQSFIFFESVLFFFVKFLDSLFEEDILLVKFA